MTLSIFAGSDTMVASAQMHDDSERLAQKMIDIEQNFAQYLVAESKRWEIEMQIRDIDQKMTKQKQDGETSLLAQRASLEAKLNTLWQKIDTLQEQSYTLHKIPEAKMQKLEQVKNQAIQHYAASDMLDTVFIDAAEESVLIILSAPEHSDVSPDTVAPKRFPRSTGDDFQSLAGMYGIVVETKHFTCLS